MIDGTEMLSPVLPEVLDWATEDEERYDELPEEILTVEDDTFEVEDLVVVLDTFSL